MQNVIEVSPSLYLYLDRLLDLLGAAVPIPERIGRGRLEQLIIGAIEVEPIAAGFVTTFMIPMADRTRSWLMRDFASLVVGRSPTDALDRAFLIHALAATVGTRSRQTSQARSRRLRRHLERLEALRPTLVSAQSPARVSGPVLARLRRDSDRRTPGYAGLRKRRSSAPGDPQ